MPRTGVLHLVCKFRKAFSNKMLSYFLVAFQWLLIVVIMAFDVHLSVAVPGGLSNGGLKVIMVFPVFMLVSSVISCLLFLRLRREGIIERCIATLSMITVFFSIANISLHFVNNLVLLMKTSEVIAWSSYSIMFSLIAHKIFQVYVVHMWRSSGSRKSVGQNSRNLWTQD